MFLYLIYSFQRGTLSMFINMLIKDTVLMLCVCSLDVSWSNFKSPLREVYFYFNHHICLYNMIIVFISIVILLHHRAIILVKHATNFCNSKCEKTLTHIVLFDHSDVDCVPTWMPKSKQVWWFWRHVSGMHFKFLFVCLFYVQDNGFVRNHSLLYTYYQGHSV